MSYPEDEVSIVSGLKFLAYLVIGCVVLGLVLSFIKVVLEEQEAYEEMKATIVVKPSSISPPVLCVNGVQYYRLPTSSGYNIKGMAPVIDKDTLTFVRCE